MGPRATYYLVSSLNWFANVLPMAVMVLIARSRGLSLADIGYFLGAYSLTVVLLELPSGALADAIGRKRTYLLAGCVGIVAKAVFLFAFGLPAFLLYALTFGVSRALSSGALEAWFIDALQAADPDVGPGPALGGAGPGNRAAVAPATFVASARPGLCASLPQPPTAGLTPCRSRWWRRSSPTWWCCCSPRWWCGRRRGRAPRAAAGRARPYAWGSPRWPASSPTPRAAPAATARGSCCWAPRGRCAWRSAPRRTGASRASPHAWGARP